LKGSGDRSHTAGEAKTGKKPVRSYEDLEVFQRSHHLAVQIYRLIRDFPSAERFRLTDQLCRAAMSVPANIAEGYGRFHRKDLTRFLYISRGSAEETRYFLLLARDLGYLDAQQCQALRDEYTEVTRMLNGLVSYHRRQLGTAKPRAPEP